MCLADFTSQPSLAPPSSPLAAEYVFKRGGRRLPLVLCLSVTFGFFFNPPFLAFILGLFL
jgi:hypothetical protein